MGDVVIRAIGWALVHFIWQGALIGGATAVVLLLCRRAQVRYVAGVAGLGVMLLVASGTALRIAIAERAEQRAHLVPPRSFQSDSVQLSVPFNGAEPLATPVASVAPVPLAWWSRELVERWLPAAFFIWLGGVLALSLNLLRGWLHVLRIRNHAVTPVPDVWTARVDVFAARLGVTRPVRVLETALVEVPSVVGWLRPIILLPAAALSGLSPAQLNAIIAHELAHVRRHDYLVNLLQAVVETLLFFHPAVWWLSHRVRTEREHCCDDIAVALCGNRMTYLRALMRLEEVRQTRTAFAMAADGTSLLARVRRLSGRPAPAPAGWPVLAGIVMVTALSLGVAGVSVAKSGLPDEIDLARSIDVQPSASSTSASQAQPVRDGAVQDVRSSSIVVGRVVEAGSNAPLYRVRITLQDGGMTPRTGVTDVNGVFTLRDVAPGRYTLSAARSGYLTTEFGQRRAGERGQPLDVRQGEGIEGIEVALPRGAVLAGRILDEVRDPAPGVRVEALAVRFAGGRRRPVTVATAATNDLGEFRVGGLEPGSYFIRASSSEMWFDEDEKATAHAFAPTLYPGAMAVDQAQAVVVTYGQEVANLDFRLVAGRAVRVAGIVRHANGDPAVGQAVTFNRLGRTSAGFFFGSGSARTDASGAFEMRDVPPGEYQVMAANQPAESVTRRISVEDVDLTGLVLTLHGRGAIEGTVVDEDGGVPVLPGSALRLVTLPADDLTTPLLPRVMVSNGRFRLQGFEGVYLFRLEGLPVEWTLRAVQIDGRDVTDTPFDVTGRNIDTLRLVVTRRGSQVVGDVADARGNAESRSTIVVFAEDDAKWGLGSRFVRAARPTPEGRFAIGNLPPGDYLAATRSFIADGEWEDQAFLRTLVEGAIRIRVGEGGVATVRLRLPEEPR